MYIRYHRDQKGKKKTTEKISSRRRVRTRKDDLIEDPYRSSTSIQPSNKRIRRRIKGTTKGSAEVNGNFSSPLHNYKCLVYFPLLRGYSVKILWEAIIRNKMSRSFPAFTGIFSNNSLRNSYSKKNKKQENSVRSQISSHRANCVISKDDLST